MATYPSTLGTTTPIGNSLLTIQATSTDSILATLRAFAGQIANLFQIQDSSGVNLFSIGSSGALTIGSLNGPLQANAGVVSATSSIGVLYGGTGLTNAPSYGNILVGNSSGGYALTATSSLGLGGSSGTVTSVALTAPTGLTVTGSPITTSGTLALSLTSGYAIPLTASTTEYDSAFSNRITSASSPLAITNHVISLSTAGDWTGTFDSQEGSYYLNANNLTNFGTPFYTYFSATTTDALTQGSTNKYYSTNLFAGSLAGTTTTALAEGNNLYFTNTRADARAVSVLSATTSLPNITALGSLATVGTITSGIWQGTAVGVAYGGTGSTTLSGILLGNGTSQVQTLTVGSGLTLTGTTLSTAGGSGITALGPTGQTQTGTTITLATSTSVANGLTSAVTIIGSGNTLTFTPSLSGTLTVAGGGTGSTNGSVTGTGALSFTSDTSSALTLDSGTTGAINIGTNTNAKTITIGNGTGATSLVLNAGTGNIDIGVNAFARTINVGTGGAVQTVTVGSTNSTSALTLQSGNNNIKLEVGGSAVTGNVQIGGAAGATPDLLVLDTKNTSGDPTGTGGAMYYNSNSGKFRCYENGAWANCIGAGGGSGTGYTIVEKTADESTNTDTTLNNDTDLQFSASANTAYIVEFIIRYHSTSATPDFKYTITGPTGAIFRGIGLAYDGTSDTGNVNIDACNIESITTLCTIVGTQAPDFLIHITGIMEVQGTSGTVAFQWAQNNSNATNITVDQDSILRYLTLSGASGADLAELYSTNDSSLSPGDVVSLDTSLSAGVRKSGSPKDSQVIGIISTSPGLVTGGISNEGERNVLVALSGRVPVKVVTENGAIQAGDYLTPSSVSGVAMKAGGSGPVIGQAISAYDAVGTGIILAFVKNFELGSIQQVAVLIGDISPKVNVDGSDNGLSTLVATIQSETAHDPIAIIAKKITNGRQFLTDFVAARVTAIRGYFDEVFAKKVHTEQICVKKSDGSELCVNGDQIETLLQNNAATPVIPTPTQPSPTPEQTPTPTPTPAPTPEVLVPQTNEPVPEETVTPAPTESTPVETPPAVEQPSI